MSRNIKEFVIEKALLFSALTSILTTLIILYILLTESWHFFQHVSLKAVLIDTQWTPLFAEKHFGLWPLLFGTFLITAIAMSVALPAGLLIALFLSEYATPRLRGVIKPVLEILAGIPTVVYGYFALVFVTPMLRHFIPSLAVFNALSAGLVMGIMILPIVSSLSEDAFSAVSQNLREAAYALGGTELDVSLRVVFPTAFSGVASACILAISRAIGETMIVTIAAGMKPTLTLNPFDSLQTVTAYIVQVSLGDTPAGTIEYQTIFLAGTVLFLFTMLLNLMSQRLKGKFVERFA